MDAEYFTQEIYKVAKRIGNMKLFNHVFPFNNTEMQMMKEIIRVKEEGGRIISSDLAKLLGVTRSAVSQMVNKLEKNNVVMRVPDEKDRKIAYIELSGNARAVYEDVKQKLVCVMNEVVKKMGEEKIKSFIENAVEFAEILDETIEKYGHLGLPKLGEGLFGESSNNQA